MYMLCVLMYPEIRRLIKISTMFHLRAVEHYRKCMPFKKYTVDVILLCICCYRTQMTLKGGKN